MSTALLSCPGSARSCPVLPHHGALVLGLTFLEAYSLFFTSTSGNLIDYLKTKSKQTNKNQRTQHHTP